MILNRVGCGAMQLAGRDEDKLVWRPPCDVDAGIALLRKAVASGVNHRYSRVSWFQRQNEDTTGHGHSQYLDIFPPFSFCRECHLSSGGECHPEEAQAFAKRRPADEGSMHSWQGAPLLAFFARGGRINSRIFGPAIVRRR